MTKCPCPRASSKWGIARYLINYTLTNTSHFIFSFNNTMIIVDKMRASVSYVGHDMASYSGHAFIPNAIST